MFGEGKILLLVLLGVSGGVMIAAGIFAFLVMIGIFPRLIDKTNTKRSIWLYETCMALGGTLGNMWDLFKWKIPVGGQVLLGISGLMSGIFVGCLVMSLAETLKALPIFTKRIQFTSGLQYLILFMAFGKTLGSFLYFIFDIGF